MTDHTDTSLARRTVLAGIGSAALATGIGVGTVAGDEHGDGDVTVTIDNVGANAWEVTETDDEDVAPTGVENPTLTLTVDTRYTFVNDGGAAHPLAFRDAGDEPLISQEDADDDGDDNGGGSGPGYSLDMQLLSSGAFADDPEVDLVTEDDRMTFTVTGALADELNTYVCTVHPAMVGDIETEGGPEPDQDDEPVEQTDDAAPGFGIGAAAAGIGGLAAYLRARRTE